MDEGLGGGWLFEGAEGIEPFFIPTRSTHHFPMRIRRRAIRMYHLAAEQGMRSAVLVGKCWKDMARLFRKKKVSGSTPRGQRL